MASSYRIPLSEVIDNLESEDFDDLIAEGSDDDLGMDIDYSYNSDSLEGIIQQNKFHKALKL